MSPDTPVTRRKILLGLGGIGTLSMAGGATTAAYFSDSESFIGTVRAGVVDIGVNCADCVVENDRLKIGFDPINPGEQKSQEIQLTVADSSNPVRVWLMTDCPPDNDPLGETLEARLLLQRDCAGESEPLYPADGWVTLTELRQNLTDGIRLDDPADPCVDGGTSHCLQIEYRLPEDATWLVESESNLTFEFGAQQCRHVPEEDFEMSTIEASSSCSDGDCPDCVELGKVEVEDDRLEADMIYAFDELARGFADDEHEYELEILTVTDKADDTRETVCASFRLLRDGSELDAPQLCEAAIAGGRPQGQPSDPDSRDVVYDIDPPLTRSRGELCAAHDKDDPESEPDGERPAISHVTVFVCPDGGAS